MVQDFPCKEHFKTVRLQAKQVNIKEISMKRLRLILYFFVAGIGVIWILSVYFKNDLFDNKLFLFDNKIKNIEMPLISIANSDRVFDAEEKNTIGIYERLNSAVVNITYLKTEYVRYFFELYPEKSQGQGSGAIIDPKGYIVTNYHVVGDAEKVTVALTQEEGVFNAEIVGIDPENDIAVIKIKNPPQDLNCIPLGNSNDLKIGQKVYAIGNPFGLDRTLTSGIISGLGRPLKTDNGNIIEDSIQTDASINPGNSGGPLIDSAGKMIGINSMIISPSGGSVGLGFAIPVDTVREVVNELIKYGYVKRGWIDATFLPITPRIAQELGYNVSSGLMVMAVARNGEAYKAGLRGGNEKAYYGSQIIYVGGEIIVAIDGMKINDYSDMIQVLKKKKPGEVINVAYFKDNVKNNANIKLIDKRKFTESN
jgi:S1-C subfamily serine protease